MRYKDIVHLDFETFFSREYSLSKMATILYVRDPRFQCLGVAVARNDDPSVYLSEEEFLEWAEDIDWSTTALQAFNCAFDACVLTQQYGIKPAYYICSQSAARGLIPYLPRHNLKTVAPSLGLGEKGDALQEGSHAVTKELADYACNDNELARGIWRTLYPLLSETEQDMIDLTVRMAVEPTLELDAGTLHKVRDKAILERDAAIAASGYTEAQLNSNPQFAEIVRKLGLVPPTKISATTGEETEAFAKGDDEWVEFMLTYPEYLHIWEGRLAAKSNINIRRPEKLLEIAATGSMPMPTLYCGGHTGRSSGCDGLNVQNLPQLNKSDLRLAFTAPKGHRIVVADSSGIELRTNMWFCGQEDKLDILRSGGDIYKDEAAGQFNKHVDEITKQERQFGKVVQLGAGYGMGAVRFRKYCAAGPLGMDPIYLTENEAFDAIYKYRANNERVQEMWRKLSSALHDITHSNCDKSVYRLRFMHNAIGLPSGRQIQYFSLRQDEQGSWCYGVDKKVRWLHGGSVLENVVQAMARDIVADQMLTVAKEMRVVGWTHDEIIAVVPERDADDALKYMIEVMSVPPSWAPGLPLGAEGGHAEAYSK